MYMYVDMALNIGVSLVQSILQTDFITSLCYLKKPYEYPGSGGVPLLGLLHVYYEQYLHTYVDMALNIGVSLG